MPKKPPRKPLLPETVERQSQVNRDDVPAARANWKKHAVPKLRDLLDATKKK